jgi:hypothetical protein
MVAVGAPIEDRKGQMPLVKYMPVTGGFWQGNGICAGGELEEGQTIEEGRRKEIKKETNLDIELTKPLVPFDRV